LGSEDFSIGDLALDSGLPTSYDAGTQVLTITIGNAAIDVDAADGATSTIYASSSVKALTTGLDLDTLITGKVVVARTGITHNSIYYNTVKSPVTGVYWLDRNLDATKVATSATDTASFGGLYQWGRPADGHQIHSTLIPVTGELSAGGVNGSVILSTTITPLNDIFIQGSIAPSDWVDITALDGKNNNNGSGRSSYLSKIDGNGICPVGFRVPSEDEFQSDLTIDGVSDISTSADAFTSYLKIPSAGLRWHTDGTYNDDGSAWMHVSDANGVLTRVLLVHPSIVLFLDEHRASGMSVRCRSHIAGQIVIDPFSIP
jgi:hypothetical protein